MKFVSVRLENLFAYEDQVEFDFSGTTGERNVALVWGRNGMGKTSFLRSLKLLFLGIEPKSVRTIGVPARVLPQRQYIVGDGAGWSGLINRRAVRRAEGENRDPTASVSATWQLDDGSQMQVERRWTCSQFSFTEALVVFDRTGRITDEAAKDRLDELMPEDFVDFFFFDGEDIKTLAESDERKAINFDRLLRLTFLGDLAEELRVLTRERTRGGPGDQLVERLAETESALARSARLTAAGEEELQHIDEMLVTDVALLRRLQNRREGLGSGATDRDRENLESSLTDLKRDWAEQQETIAKTLPVAAPLVANLSMVRTALEDVELRVRSIRPAERAFAGRIGPKLESWIGQAPVELDEEDASALAEHLRRRIEQELPGQTAEGLFGNVDELRADRLRSTLLRWSVAGGDVARTHVAALTNARRLDREIREAEEAMMRLEVGSHVNLERYRQVSNEIAALEERIADANQRKGQLQGRIEEGGREVARLRSEMDRLHDDQDRMLRERSEAMHLARIATALNELRDDPLFPGRAQVDVRATIEGETVVLSVWTGTPSPFLTWKQSELSGIAQVARQAFLCLGRNGPVPVPVDGSDDLGLAFFRSVSAERHAQPLGLWGQGQDLPTVLYFPADRTIVAPQDERVVQRPENWGYQPAQVFRADGPDWRNSIDNLLVWLEWLDDTRIEDLLAFLNEELFSETPGKIIRRPARQDLLTYVEMPTGIHPLSHLSQGERAILQVLARTMCHMTRNTLILIDEIENHLHPKWMQQMMLAMKAMIRRRGSNVSVVFTTHNVELLTTFDHLAPEEGIVKGGLLIDEDMR